MRLSSLARRLPESVWSLFEPILPPVVWCGEGRPPVSNHACLHGVIYVLITGIGWEYVPPCFPCGKTLQDRLDRWLASDAFRTAWVRMAERYQELRAINWDRVLLDGSKKPSKKGHRHRPQPDRPGQVRDRHPPSHHRRRAAAGGDPGRGECERRGADRGGAHRPGRPPAGPGAA